jgi:hypothetical protein
MVQSPQEANRHSAGQISCLLFNPKIHYSVHKSPPVDSILSHTIPVHTLTPYLRYILILSSHICGEDTFKKVIASDNKSHPIISEVLKFNGFV